MTYTEHDELLVEIQAMTEQLDLGPVADVQLLDADSRALQVELDEQAAAATLLAWGELITVVDTRVGVRDDADDWVRVHLRGTSPELGAVVVTLPLHRTRRARQAELAWQQAHRGPYALLGRLAELDPKGVQ